MTKLVYKKTILDKLVVPGTLSAKSNLNSAISTCALLKVPDNFQEKNYLLLLSDEIQKDINNLTIVGNLLTDSARKFAAVADSIEREILAIDKSDIVVKKSSVTAVRSRNITQMIK